MDVKISKFETSMSDKVKEACIAKIRHLFRETKEDAARRKKARQAGQKYKANEGSGEFVRKEIGLWEVSHALRHNSAKFVEDEVAGAVEFRPSVAFLTSNGFEVVARRLSYSGPSYDLRKCVWFKKPSYNVDRLFVRCPEITKEMEAKREYEKQ